MRRPLARIAPTNSTKLRWNVGSVNAIEKDINSGSATLGKLTITRLPSGPRGNERIGRGSFYAQCGRVATSIFTRNIGRSRAEQCTRNATKRDSLVLGSRRRGAQPPNPSCDIFHRLTATQRGLPKQTDHSGWTEHGRPRRRAGNCERSDFALPARRRSSLLGLAVRARSRQRTPLGRG